MLAKDLDVQLRRIGIAFIVGLVVQPRISGRAIALPVTAGVLVAMLWGLKPLAVSARARRAWLAIVGCAIAAVVLGVIGLSPSAEPGAMSLLVLLVFVGGLVAYTALFTLVAADAHWTDAGEHLRRVRINLYAVVVVDLVAAVLAVALGTRVRSGADGPPWWNVVFGHEVSNWAVVGFSVVVFILWVGAATELERASKAIRTRLRADPEAPAPTG